MRESRKTGTLLTSVQRRARHRLNYLSPNPSPARPGTSFGAWLSAPSPRGGLCMSRAARTWASGPGRNSGGRLQEREAQDTIRGKPCLSNSLPLWGTRNKRSDLALLDVGLGASGIWNWLRCLCLEVTDSKPSPREMCQSCWWVLNNSTEWADGLGLVPRKAISRSFCWQCESTKHRDPQGGKAVEDVRRIFPMPPNRSACKTGLLTLGISPEITSAIKISFFPVWDITIPIYLPLFWLHHIFWMIQRWEQQLGD